MFSHSRTVNDRRRLIGPGEWIWADSAYPVETWCVTPYKKPASNIPENKIYNFWVSHVPFSSLLLYVPSDNLITGSYQVGACCRSSERPVSVPPWAPSTDQE